MTDAGRSARAAACYRNRRWQAKGRGDCVRSAMPIKKYLLWVGGVLLCMMFALDAYLPKAEPRKDYDFDRTGLRINAPDTGIAPDTGAVAISGGPALDEAAEPKGEKKAPAQAFAKLEPGAAKKSQRKKVARLQSAKPAQAAQNPWSSQWSSDWSSNWNANSTSNWTSNWTWRGPIAEAPRSNARRQASKQATGNPSGGNWNFNFAGAGRNASCWGC